MSGPNDLAFTITMRDEAKAVLAQFTNELKQGGGASQEMATKLALTNKALKDAQAISAQLSGGLKNVGGAAAGASHQFDLMASSGLRVSERLGGVVRAYGPLIGLGGGVLLLGTAFKSAFAASNEFEKSMLNMEALVGVSKGQIDEWRGSMMQMAVEFGRDPQEVAKAMYFITSSGYSGAQAMDVLKASAEAAGAGMGDMMTIADAATSAVSAYGQGNLKAADAVGQMLEAVKVGKMEPAELAQSIGQVLGVSSQVGVQFKDVASAAAALSLSGMKAAESMTTIRQTLLAISAPGRQAMKVFSEAGTSAQDLQKVFRDQGYLAGVQKLVDLAQKFKDPGTALRQMVQDVQAVNAAFLLTGKNADQVKGIFDDIGKSGAAQLDQAWKIAAANTTTTFAQFKALAETTFIEIGDAMAPALSGGVSNVVSLFDTLRAHTDDLKAALIALGVTATATFAVLNRGAIVTGLTSAFGSAAVAADLLAGQFIVVEGAVLTASGAIVDFTSILAATGWGALVIAIGAASYALVKMYQETHQAITAQGQFAASLKESNDLSDKATSALDGLAKAHGRARDAAMEEVKALQATTQAHLVNAQAALKDAQAELSAKQTALDTISPASSKNKGGMSYSQIGGMSAGSMSGPTGYQVLQQTARKAAEQAAANKKAAQDAITKDQATLKAIQDGLNKPISVAPVSTNGSLDVFPAHQKGHHGGKTEAEKNFEDQQKQLADWREQAAKAMADAKDIQKYFGPHVNIGSTSDQEDLERQTALQDALFAKQKKAQDEAISKGHVLSDQQVQSIQLTDEETNAVTEMVDAQQFDKRQKAAFSELTSMDDALAATKAQTQAYQDQLVPYYALAAVAEVRAKAAKDHLSAEQEALLVAKAIQQASANITLGQAKDARAAGFDRQLTAQDYAARSGMIGFDQGSADQQAQLAVWQKTYDLRKQSGDLTKSITPEEVAAIRDQTQAQYDLNEAVQKFNDQKQAQMDFFDAFSSFFQDSVTGAKSLKSAFGDLIKTIENLVVQYMILLPMKQAFERSVNSGGGLFSSLGMAFATFGFAKGGVFSKGAPIPFANGAVVGSPTLFPMAGGRTGLMGEAGPEAIMPLERGANGKLGIRTNSGNGSVFSPNISITVNGTDLSDPAETGRLIGKAVEAKMVEFAGKNMRPGGILYQGGMR